MRDAGTEVPFIDESFIDPKALIRGYGVQLDEGGLRIG
jgi:hypothetical protein